MLVAFDLLEHDGADLCALPLIERKRRHTIPTASKTETRLGSKAMRHSWGRSSGPQHNRGEPIRSTHNLTSDNWFRQQLADFIYAVCFSTSARVSATVGLVRQRRARIHGEENEQACVATDGPGDRHRRFARESYDQQGPNQARNCVRSRSLRESDGDEGQGADERLVL